MILSDKTIKEYIDRGELVIEPFNIKCLQPASYDIILSDSFAIPAKPKRSGKSGSKSLEDEFEYNHIKTDTFYLYPKKFVLASTKERIKLPPNLACFVEGRSSVGRLGLFVQNAGWGDPGFEGEITLELFNAGAYTIELKAGTRLGQLIFAETTTPVETLYSGKYQGQTGATGSMLYKDFKEDNNG